MQTISKYIHQLNVFRPLNGFSIFDFTEIHQWNELWLRIIVIEWASNIIRSNAFYELKGVNTSYFVWISNYLVASKEVDLNCESFMVYH